MYFTLIVAPLLALTALFVGCSRMPGVENAVVGVAWEASVQSSHQAEIEQARAERQAILQQMHQDARRLAEAAERWRTANESHGVLVNDLLGADGANLEWFSGARVGEVVLIAGKPFTLRHDAHGLVQRYDAQGRALR
ncbi:MAG: hypothetical protein ACFB20_08910 [Opitutales bacterium]